MKKLKISLLGRIAIAIALGIVIGILSPEWIVRIFNTFKALFGEFLGFTIPLIIVGLVTPAIADVGKKAGNILIITVLIAYASTLFAGFASYFTGVSLFPSIINAGPDLHTASPADAPAPFFTLSIPAVMSVMTALVLAFVTGLCLAATQHKVLLDTIHGFEEIVTMTIKKAIIPLLPVYIFGIFLNMTYVGEVYSILSVFIKIIGIIFALHIVILLIQYCIAGALAKKNPFRMLLNMLPAYFTALGTQSSAATIPVTLEQTRKNGVSEDISGFVIPLCATIHLAGSTLKIVACALALMIMQGTAFDFGMFAGFICMLGITMVAAPGVPGGAIMAALGVLQSILGFDQEAQALMIALYIAMDSFGTACNVTGDGAIAVIIEKIFGKKDN